MVFFMASLASVFCWAQTRLTLNLNRNNVAPQVKRVLHLVYFEKKKTVVQCGVDRFFSMTATLRLARLALYLSVFTLFNDAIISRTNIVL